MSDLYTDSYAIRDCLEKGFTDEAIAAAKKQAEAIAYDLVTNIEYSLKEEMADIIAGHARDLARNAIEAILNGDEKRMRTHLGLEGFNGRTDGYNPSGKQKSHPVIHGEFFEQGGIKLRRAIVDAYPDLLKNERILDLEDQIRSLVEQVREKDAEIDRMRNRIMYG